MKNINVTIVDGGECSLTLRKLSLSNLGKLASDISEEEKACLCIAPEGRTPEEVRAVFESLDDESQFEVWEQGLALNEDNLQRYSARRKKLAEASGMDIEALVREAVRENLQEMMQRSLAEPSPASSSAGTAGETSTNTTAPTSSKT